MYSQNAVSHSLSKINVDSLHDGKLGRLKTFRHWNNQRQIRCVKISSHHNDIFSIFTCSKKCARSHAYQNKSSHSTIKTITFNIDQNNQIFHIKSVKTTNMMVNFFNGYITTIYLNNSVGNQAFYYILELEI